jgi:hypothetical protein
LFWWVTAWFALLSCALIRDYMDDIGLPVYGAGTERALFGTLPSEWLQVHIYPLSPNLFSWLVAVVHATWFVVPWLIAVLVTWKRPHRLRSFFLWWFTLHFSVNVFFAVFPLEPPWMADAEVLRLVALHTGSSGIPDKNPMASMPSLHVALPFLLSLWLFRERWTLPALATLAYTALIGLEVVFSGEHYVIDLLGAIAVAGAIAWAARIDFRTEFSRLRARLGWSVPSPPSPGLRTSAGSQGVQAVRPGLTSQPVAILGVAAALIVLVSFKIGISAAAVGSSDMLDPPRLAASGGTSIALRWTPLLDENVEGYRVLRGTGVGGPFVEIAQVTPRTAVTFTDDPPAGTYFYVVRSFSADRNGVNSNQASAISSAGSRATLP